MVLRLISIFILEHQNLIEGIIIHYLLLKLSINQVMIMHLN